MKQLTTLLIATMTSLAAFTQPICTDYTFTMDTDLWGEEISWNITDASGNIIYLSVPYASNSSTTEIVCLSDGCYALNLFDTFGDGWNGGVLQTTINSTGTFLGNSYDLASGSYAVYGLSINTSDSCDVQFEVPGCTDPQATNYNPQATLNDGSCYYNNDSIDYYGCTDPAALNYWPWATIDDGSCVYPIDCGTGQLADVYVCVFSEGQNVGFELVDDAGNVIISQMGYDNFAIEHTDVCLEPGVCYTANLSNLEGPYGWYNGYFWVNTGGIQITTGELGDNQQYASYSFSIDGTCGDVYGCTDPNSMNYDPSATIDDGSCIPLPPDSCESALVSLTLNTGSFGNEVSFTVSDENGNVIGAYSGFSSQSTYNLYACVEDGCYTLDLADSWGDGWNGATLSVSVDGVTILSGVTIENGFSGTATIGVNAPDCQNSFDIFGCTDPGAWNYNPLATIDDGSCWYDSTQTCQASFELISIDPENDVVYLDNTSIASEGASYLWDFGDGGTSQEEYPTHQYEEGGLYLICLTVFDNAFCTSSYCDTIFYDPDGIVNSPNGSNTLGSNGWTLNVIDGSALGIGDLPQLEGVSLYPVPAAELLTLELNTDITENLVLNVLDMRGSVVEQRVVSMGQSRLQLDVSDLSEGMYILELYGNETRTLRRFNVLK